ncbi:MAG TPA: putative toxin-antitoxin system toxin component, PIN family [Candidatus Acidoferrum sp.]|nr:putative toxin-antitoxin system toxin component, PIN family [Candidatus Acidoferrum sp.]
MIVCLDTNTVVQALARGHPFHPILDSWVAGQITWAVSTEVLLEYEEVLTRMSGPARWRKLARLMDLVELTGGNLLRVTPFFRFQIITTDPDDNIFTDCAVTAGADYLITEDHHFAALSDAGYKPRPITPGKFISGFVEGVAPDSAK